MKDRPAPPCPAGPSASAAPPTADGPTACCRDVATTMIGHFVTRLEVEAAKSGGCLDTAQIRALARRFVAAEQGRFRRFYQRAWDECGARREALARERLRHQSFDRLLMRRFAHLFPPRDQDDGAEGVLSRRMIPGFALALDKMVGPERRAQAEQAARALLDRHPGPEGGCDWAAAYADPAAQALVDEVLVLVAGVFDPVERRRAWLVELINAHLAPAAPGAPDRGWRLSEAGADRLLTALFAPLAERVTRAPEAARARWGAAAAGPSALLAGLGPGGG